VKAKGHKENPGKLKTGKQENFNLYSLGRNRVLITSKKKTGVEREVGGAMKQLAFQDIWWKDEWKFYGGGTQDEIPAVKEK